MVMAGGGFRCGYYLGMYAAAEECGQKPDVLLASCGGAIAAALVHALPSDRERRAWLASADMHRFLRGLQSTPRAALMPAFTSALRRRFDARAAPLIPDLFNDYLFELPAIPLPAAPAQPHVALAIIGAKLLFEPEDVGQPRADRKLYAETVFCDARTAALLDGGDSPVSLPANAIAERLRTCTDVSMTDAVRASIADMFYFRCHAIGDAHYAGGVIDLFPLELAHRLAPAVIAERKSPFEQQLAVPALRTVFGLDGNARHATAHAHDAAAWVDTRDVSTALRGSGVIKKMAWRENRIRLVKPGDVAVHAADVERQWRYGYERAMRALTRQESA
jgi:predicted acylesterase/phospholipase RssA